MGRSWFDAGAAEFAATNPAAIFGELARQIPFELEQMQRQAWLFEIAHLQAIARHLPESHIWLEFAIPRMGRRADALVMAGGTIFLLEYKVGATSFTRHAMEQVHGYALDLRNFHETSHDRPIIPIVIATEAPAQHIPLIAFDRDGVARPLALSPGDILPAMQQLLRLHSGAPVDPRQWEQGRYRPTPTIIEAAQALFRGHAVEEISRSEAGAENLSRTAEAIQRIVAHSHANAKKSLVFLTGVPGAGKTLAGLNLACARLEVQGEDATFLSGNGPLVEVLREALKRDARRRASAPDPGDPEAQHINTRSPDKFIQNVHHFRDEYLADLTAPSEHVVIFDEAQRAWDETQTSRFMREKRGQTGFSMSEPQFLLSVMDRHPHWCTVICLVGEGQEINRGEAGIGAWIEALANPAFRDWQVHASPHLAANDTLSRGARWLLDERASLDAALHLAVSVRSFRAEQVSAFISALLGEDAAQAASLLPPAERFPIFRTRSLSDARAWLRAHRRAGERAGILASSNALRLKPEGLYVKARPDVAAWFLNDGADVRASNALEDVATEFEVQGLELDWTCVAWDLNLFPTRNGWDFRSFRGTRWQRIADGANQSYLRNAHRVLLTRARQGMVIYVPMGDAEDETRNPDLYDAIDKWLRDCGIPDLSLEITSSPPPIQPISAAVR